MNAAIMPAAVARPTDGTATAFELDNVGNLDAQAVREELNALRHVHSADMHVDSEARKELNMTVQKRLREFLERGWKQARELIKLENRALLTSLLGEVGITAGASEPKLFEQIAFLQMCHRIERGPKKDTFDVPGRRYERIGRIYRVIHKKGWEAEGLAKRLDIKGGVGKLLNDNKFVDPQAEQVREQRRARVLRDPRAHAFEAAYADEKEGKWGLALVHFQDGIARVHSGLDAKEADIMRYVDAYCARRSPEMAAEAEERAMEQVGHD